ncbi:Transcriptional repressor EZH1 [Handroanthus impetiginosus]|uniref:Transcriptional repressor EZH1 n=1 Tax=Handroanthus impetiginosus TaxID=429701 RepID=A0A2G9GT56_9LAMI|nr:Transcriptional repressor EZH1 [Handroanthus impetiginosus]
MVSKSKLRKYHGDQGNDTMTNLFGKLTHLKRQIQSERVASVREKLAENSMKVQGYVSDLEAFAASRSDSTVTRTSSSGNFLSLRMNYPPCKARGFIPESADKDDAKSQEVVFPLTAKLPLIERIPPYITWIFFDRNQRMPDDQSVVGRRRIYYDQHGSEALICSDSEEELGQLECEKHEFSEGEDRVMREALQECELGNEVLNMLTQFVGGTPLEIQERCSLLMEKDEPVENQTLKREEGSEDNIFLDKSLSAALDSFDNLFCRRCLVFDCRLHGCSQNLIYPNEKQPYPFDPEEDRKPCGDQCYLQLNVLKDLLESPMEDPLDGHKAPDEGGGSLLSSAAIEQAHHLESEGRHIMPEPTNSLAEASKLVSDELVGSASKKLKLANPKPPDNSKSPVGLVAESSGSHEYELERDAARDKGKDITEIPSCSSSGNSIKVSHGRTDWKPFEKDLYAKGLEIFGRNRYGNELDIPVKSRICRKRGRVRKVKSSWKSAGHPSLWRRIADGKDLPCKQYVPCGCQPVCGKQCPCLQNGTCCEKYCGCSKSCKNRLRGCHCAKSQCKSRQCPCFAAGRECDPDVCRNCWVSCGDGSLGEPPRRGDSQCGNMKLLLRQQQRILLAKSDVAGWGAFLKNSVNKNDYLGEYTGELISHQEADKRGKIYDRANSSFLFDLNDKYVLDACRKGDKLKFANHSSTPNCYAKVMLVAGDHRVGIYANEHIGAGEELFYDYRYGPDQAPAWARRPESSRRDGSPVRHGRAKKHQSG